MKNDLRTQWSLCSGSSPAEPAQAILKHITRKRSKFPYSAILAMQLLLGCLTYTSLAQRNIVDSLQNMVSNPATPDTVKVSALNMLSHEHIQVEPKKSIDYAESALKLAQQLKYKNGIAAAYRQISQYYWTQSDHPNSLRYAFMALKEFEALNIPKQISACYLIIGSNYSDSKEFDKALYYQQLSYQYAKKLSDRNYEAAVVNNIGAIFERQKAYDSALAYYIKASQLWENGGNTRQIILGLNNIGSTYNYLGNYGKAEEYLHRALTIATEADSKYSLGLLYHSLGEVHFNRGDYKQCIDDLKKSIRFAQDIGNTRNAEAAYQTLLRASVSIGDYKSAYEYQGQLMQLKDTIFNQNRARQVAEIQTKYETGKKEQTILLLEQERKLQAARQNFLLATVVIIVAASSIIFVLQRSRSKKARQLNEKLTEVDRLKSHFFANISHEFRTPLTLVIAPLEQQLKKRSLPEEEKEQLLLIQRNANRLLDLVNQLLDLSKLEAGKMELSVKQGNLDNFLKAISASFESWAEQKGIHFERILDIPNTLEWYDADKVEKIITNLLANALKFTPVNGTVKITVKYIGSPEARQLSIVVQDTGKGIADDEQGKIFLPFYQTRQQTNRTFEGSGLGLSLVKELVKLYNGTISLQSSPGQGTAFYVQLPLDKHAFSAHQLDELMPARESDIQIEKRSLEDEDTDALPEMRPGDDAKDTIIVAEDNTELRNYITSLLKDDFTVIATSNGDEALKAATQHVPNLVLSDVMMPKLDGIALTEKLKSDERTSHIPVILLTARNEHQSKLDGLRIGADDYLTKPFSNEELLVRVTNLIGQRKHLAERFREKVLVQASPMAAVSLDDKFLLRVKETVEMRMVDPSFTVDELAEEVHLSRTQLLRKLKALTGLAPAEFIKDLRLKRAAQLISQRADTITQIGYTVGFNDQSYFTKCFKRHYGMTPSEFSEQVTRGTVKL